MPLTNPPHITIISYASALLIHILSLYIVLNQQTPSIVSTPQALHQTQPITLYIPPPIIHEEQPYDYQPIPTELSTPKIPKFTPPPPRKSKKITTKSSKIKNQPPPKNPNHPSQTTLNINSDDPNNIIAGNANENSDPNTNIITNYPSTTAATTTYIPSNYPKHTQKNNPPSPKPINETELWNQYANKLNKKFQAHKYYPQMAEQLNHEGTVWIDITIKNDGTIQELKIAVSSGSLLLDQAALSATKNAQPLPPFPEGITVKSKKIRIPYKFSVST